jgi:hypothetical protein
LRKVNRKFSWTDLKHLGIIGLAGIVWIPELRLFFLFYLIGFFEIYKTSKESEPELTGKKLNRYVGTLLLSQFNPFMFPLIIRQVCGQAIILFKNITGFPDRDTYVNKAEYILPFSGTWKVANGGSTKENSHSWEIFTQRYAYDFIISDSNGLSYKNKGLHLEDYYCFEKEVLSPADGEIVNVSNKIKDYTGVGDLSLDWKVKDFRGNFVIIKHHDKEYSFIAHFRLDSINVKKGQKVIQGQVIGLCGNSGHSTEPHIHFHLQDSANFWIATGLPIKFTKFEALTNESVPELKLNSFIEKNESVTNV